RMGGMDAADGRIVLSEHLGQNTGMRWCRDFVPYRLLGDHGAPGHRRHEQAAVGHEIEQPLDHVVSPISAAAENADRAVHDEDTVTRHPEVAEDRRQCTSVLQATRPPPAFAPKSLRYGRG